MFNPEETDIILKIPIFEQHEDFLAWQFDSKGLFSVRSAYRVHLDMKTRMAPRQQGEGADGDTAYGKMWQNLWKIRCPGKVHHFLWRVAHNSHPMLRNIERNGIELDTSCVLYHRLLEDGGHLFF